MRRTLVAVLLATATTGCATLTEVHAGPVASVPTREDASVGGALALHSALGTSNETTNSMTAIDVNLKGKATSVTQNLAFGGGFMFARPVATKGEVLLRGGLHWVFERYDGKVLVGGGPYAMIAGGIALDEDVYYVPGQLFSHWRRDRTLLTFGPMAEIDARFSRPSAVAFVGIGIGIAWASEVVAPPPPIFPLEPERRPLP